MRTPRLREMGDCGSSQGPPWPLSPGPARSRPHRDPSQQALAQPLERVPSSGLDSWAVSAGRSPLHRRETEAPSRLATARGLGGGQGRPRRPPEPWSSRGAEADRGQASWEAQASSHGTSSQTGPHPVPTRWQAGPRGSLGRVKPTGGMAALIRQLIFTYRLRTRPCSKQPLPRNPEPVR